MSNPKVSKEVLKAYKPARNVESAREVEHRKRTGATVPHTKTHMSKRAHKVL